ncbi:MAG: flap endonuclease-1 [DPANN group archaeon]|nr:flap endonuclease-1 [DPANN group archaeon]
MGLAIKDLLEHHEVSYDQLKGKILCIDAYNLLYQFITTIRARDGTLLMDSQGQVTSHLIGLFSRLSNFLQKGLRMCFVFDGEVPELKSREIQRRKKVKAEAARQYEEAKKQEDVEGMRKYAGRTSRLTKEMVEEAIGLIEAFGMPVVRAPSEGEAQAAHMTRKGDAYATVSQDFDSLMQGAPRLIRNLSITGRRKQAGRLAFQTVKPEEFLLRENLERLSIGPEQLIALAMLVGTDYNVGGIKGIGPKKALILVRKYDESSFGSLFKEAAWDEHFDVPWKEVYNLIKNLPVTDDYKLRWHAPDEGRIRKILVEDHDFSEERVNATLARLKETGKARAQKGLGEFF